MNNEDFVSYEIAQALKKAGFDYPCYFYYTKQDTPNGCVWHTTSEEAPIDYNRSVYAGCSMPTLAQAQKWLRETKEIYVEAHFLYEARFNTYIKSEQLNILSMLDPNFDTYESALSAGIEAALKLTEEEEV